MLHNAQGNEDKDAEAEAAAIKKLPADLQRYITAEYKRNIQYADNLYEMTWGRALLSTLSFFISFFRIRLIKQGEVGLIMDNGKPKIVSPGWYVIFSPFISFIETKNINDELIELGSTKIINVPAGKYASINDTKTGEYKLLGAGKHFIDSPDIRVIKNADYSIRFINLDDELTELGTNKIVRIKPDKKGVVYRMHEHDELKPEILNPGIYIISPPDEYVTSLSSRQQVIKLPAVKSMSGDQLPLEVHADIFYKITDPNKTINELDPREVNTYIRETATATLGEIIRSSTYSRGEVGNSTHAASNIQATLDNVSQTPTAATVEEKEQCQPPEGQNSFVLNIHAQFVEKCNKTLSNIGVRIDIRINESKITDPKTAHKLTETALQISQSRAQAQYVQTQAMISMITAQNEAAMVKVAAQGKAEALLVAAEAEKQAAIKKAQGEKEAADLLAQNELATALKKLGLFAEALGPRSQIIFGSDHLSPLAGMAALLRENVTANF
ncbi:MAG: domain / Band 7 domain containing protein [Gammaproteobacteria bacterium]|jgi:regulator of protease activity HflC (stomatin/prohibitin superfamily)|nr:domain / Band 7 domain containing protein [Gammaproteobacteria bacterium]